MAELGSVHGTCHFNDGSCHMFRMIFTPEDDNDNTRKICGHLKQFHGVGHIYRSTEVTIQSELNV